MVLFNKIYKFSSTLNILYVEDDQTFANDTCELFKNFFNQVDLSLDGKSAYEQYLNYYEKEKKYYDIVITDIRMPKMSGLDLTKNIYKHNKDQIIIVISAYSDSEVLIDFINLGIEYYIVKPFDIDDITKVLYKASTTINKNNNKISLINNYQWDLKSQQLFHNGNKIKLTKKEIQLLDIIIKKGNVISDKYDIANELWSNNEDISTNALNPIMSRLKKKLPEVLIDNIYGIGYRIQYEG